MFLLSGRLETDQHASLGVVYLPLLVCLPVPFFLFPAVLPRPGFPANQHVIPGVVYLPLLVCLSAPFFLFPAVLSCSGCPANQHVISGAVYLPTACVSVKVFFFSLSCCPCLANWKLTNTSALGLSVCRLSVTVCGSAGVCQCPPVSFFPLLLSCRAPAVVYLPLLVELSFVPSYPVSILSSIRQSVCQPLNCNCPSYISGANGSGSGGSGGSRRSRPPVVRGAAAVTVVVGGWEIGLNETADRNVNPYPANQWPRVAGGYRWERETVFGSMI